MIFNPWRKYPRWKPKKEGYYLCTIPDMESGYSYVTRLYYNKFANQWVNNDRLSVFCGYNVFKVCRAPIQENQVYGDGLCDRTEDVIAWKKLPKAKRTKMRVKE